jgi:tetratricopeptide (TPR) repeat protein
MSLKRQVSVAILVGASGMVGCKTPGSGLAFWKSSPDSAIASSAPDVGKQKYDGLAQDFGGQAKTESLGSTAALGSTKPAESEGWFSSTWNKTTGAVASAFTWDSAKESDDPTRLDSEPKKVGAEVYVSAGKLYENQGKFPEAQEQYEKALKAAPGDVSAQISLARLHDRQGNGAKALELYQKTAKAHPKNALVYNDLGLCLARQQQYPQALSALQKATELDGDNAKYRNNLAMVLVETGRPDDALKQLAAVNPEAIAHYNLGILLQQRGRNELAMQHLQQAIALDGNLGQARDLLRQMSAGAIA